MLCGGCPQQDLLDYRGIRVKLQYIVQEGRAKEQSILSLRSRRRQLSDRIALLQQSNRKREDQRRRLIQLQTAQTKSIEVLKSSSRKQQAKLVKIQTVQENYIKEINHLEGLLKNQSQLISTLESKKNCQNCYNNAKRITILSQRVLELEQEIQRLARSDSKRQQLEIMKNKLCDAKRSELQRIDRLFNQLK